MAIFKVYCLCFVYYYKAHKDQQKRGGTRKVKQKAQEEAVQVERGAPTGEEEWESCSVLC